MAASNTQEIFNEFQNYITEDHDLREEIRTCVRELEQNARLILTTLQAVHQPEGIANALPVCEKARSQLEPVKALFANLASKIPAGMYYRFHDHWKFVTQRLVFITALIVYLEKETLVTREETANILGIALSRSDGFHMDLEDFLMGLLQVASELSRLAVNAVTAGDYKKPVSIGKFVGEMDTGFRMLNLKNDSLRKRFDALKYDIKKIEEIIYDLTIRGLRTRSDTVAETAMSEDVSSSAS